VLTTVGVTDIVRPRRQSYSRRPFKKREEKESEKKRYAQVFLPPELFYAQAHAFSCNLDEPTASSVVDHGELAAASVDGLDWPYVPVDVRWLLREKLPQFPALPALTCPFVRPALDVLSPEGRPNGEWLEAGGDGLKLTSPSDPLNEWRTLELEGVAAFVVRWEKKRVSFDRKYI
jgi:hypothetical protein